MYDSRSDHPHGGKHAPRSWREMGEGDRIEWGTPRSRMLATRTATREAIREGLADCAPEVNGAFLAHGLRTAVRKREQAQYDLAVREGRDVCSHNSACTDGACFDEAREAREFVESLAYFADLFR